MNIDTTTKRILLVVGIVGAIIGLIFLIVHPSGTAEKKTGAPAVTTMTSPLVQATDQLLVNYGGSADPNFDAVQTQYRIFGLNTLPLSNFTKKQLSSTLPGYVRQYLQPAFQYTYIHIIRSTVRQVSNSEYSFDFYVDSPETYFHFQRSGEAGSAIGNPVTQIPWEGIK